MRGPPLRSLHEHKDSCCDSSPCKQINLHAKPNKICYSSSLKKKKRIVTTKCKSAPNQTIAKRKKPENDLLNPILFPVVFSLAVPVALHGFHAAHCTVHNTLRLNTGITADIGATA